jgi:tetratricopeptide (TPR) repeat protein
MKNVVQASTVIMIILFVGCGPARKPGPAKLPDTTIVESSQDMRVYRADYDTTFRAAIDALRLIDGSSAKLVKYDMGVIVFKKPNNAGTLEVKVKKLDKEKSRVTMSATSRRKYWLDGNDKKKRDAFFVELDKILNPTSPVDTGSGAGKAEQPVTSALAKPLNRDTGKESLLAELKQRLSLEEERTFLDNLSNDDLSLLNQKLDAFDSDSACGKRNARRCAACYIDLARLHHDDGRYARSAEALKAAIAIEPDNALAHCNLGDIYKHLGRIDDAIRELDKAKKLNPGLSDTYIHLGILYDDYVNDDEKALEYYRKYLELGGRDKQVLDWIHAIEQSS